MKDILVIGVDMGTTAAKTSVFDLKGRLVAEASRDLSIQYPRPGWVEQDPEEFYRATVQTIATALEKAKAGPNDVCAIGMDGQMAGFVLIDENWKPITVFDSWLDVRSSDYVKYLRKDYDDLIWETTGMPTHTHTLVPKLLWWMNERPDVFAKARKVLWASDYVAGRLAGLEANDAFVDYTYLVFSGCYDARKLDWSNELLDTFGIPGEKLPKVVKPWDVVGQLTASAAKQCNLSRGTPIVAGAGDQAAGSLGAGLVEPGRILDVAGTASVLSCCIDKFIPDTKHRVLECLKSVLPNLWMSTGNISGGGLCLRWFRDEFAAEEMDEANKRGMDAYSLLDVKAEDVQPGSERLIFIPHFAGRRDPWDGTVRGSWMGLTWRHKKEHLYRAILESVAYEYHFYLDVLKDVVPEFRKREVRVIGGGAKSRLWNQIKADVLGLTYVRLTRKESAALGSAIIAGYGTGVFSNIIETVEEWVKIEETIEPNLDRHEAYADLAEVYLFLIDNLKETYAKLAGT